MLSGSTSVRVAGYVEAGGGEGAGAATAAGEAGRQ